MQKSAPTVQKKLEEVFRVLVRKPVRLSSLSRTDAGVHAFDAVFYWKNAMSFFEVLSPREQGRFLISLNSLLGPEIQVVEIGRLRPQFSPSEGVLWKEYRYRVLSSPCLDPLLRGQTWWIRRPLNLKEIRKQIKALEGVHDFSSFAKSSGKGLEERKNGCVREVFVASVKNRPHSLLRHAEIVEFQFRASGFLHHMVRNFVGSLVDIGLGKELRLKEILLKRSRAAAGRTAPAEGLFLYRTKFRSGMYASLHPQKSNLTIY